MEKKYKTKVWSRDNGSEWLCQVMIPTEKRELVDGKWKLTGWRWSVMFSFYGDTEIKAVSEGEAFIAGEIEAELERISKRESAKAARAAAKERKSLKAGEAVAEGAA